MLPNSQTLAYRNRSKVSKRSLNISKGLMASVLTVLSLFYWLLYRHAAATLAETTDNSVQLSANRVIQGSFYPGTPWKDTNGNLIQVLFQTQESNRTPNTRYRCSPKVLGKQVQLLVYVNRRTGAVFFSIKALTIGMVKTEVHPPTHLRHTQRGSKSCRNFAVSHGFENKVVGGAVAGQFQNVGQTTVALLGLHSHLIERSLRHRGAGHLLHDSCAGACRAGRGRAMRCGNAPCTGRHAWA